ncbi:MarR family winged helix-turn-helix transcriptional regulator [Eisenibacter elegans]|jgi:DNA-binding MarR family transcriptional regulator|uniref:MarR family winged helix-turn-helix transcriptional regulator n=1 Tax=Eisenibacter elegans TaxID=997 RepID=UPI000688B7E5|nr:MarR family transcriptional regulator [Eisenibacter elegans]
MSQLSSSYILQDSLGYLLTQAKRQIGQSLQQLFEQAGHDITREQWVVLLALWEQDGRNQRDIAAWVGKDKTSVTRLIHGLERRNLVVRVQHQVDRRNKLIYLTKAGKDLQKALIDEAQRNLEIAQEDIDPQELAICKKVLRQVSHNLSNYWEQAPQKLS